ncbi:MAG: hypothetical protein ABSD59_03815 [Terracidiphilus sp.]
MAAFGVFLTGCGGSFSSGAAKAGPISIANAAGVAVQATSLALGSSVQLNMMPASDSSAAGVDWTVTCGGNPVTGSITNGACGTLAPAHTTDGGETVYTAPSQVPINTSITITATVTSNPSQSSSVSLTIVASAIGIAFNSTSVVPASLQINAKLLGLEAVVTNDPLGAGVIWTATCKSSACGTFNPAQTLSTGVTTYTAPSAVPTDGTVTIAATSLTDTTKSISATLTLTAPPPPVPVKVSVLPKTVYVEPSGSAHSASVVAVVANDPAAAGVDWSLSCAASSCGALNGSKTAHTASGVSVTYVGPSGASSGLTVTITAASTTNPAITDFATANIVTTAPIVVSISSAPPAALTTGSQATLSAKVTGDTGNLGVNWTVSCGSGGACGSFNPAHTASGGTTAYTAPVSVPAGGLVTIAASSPAATSNSAVAFTTITAAPPSLAFTQTPAALSCLTASTQAQPSCMIALTQAPVSATVANDVTPGGVAWSVECGSTVPGGCGWILPTKTASGATATYTAPPVTSTLTPVTIVATSVADPAVSISSSAITIQPSTTFSVSFIPSLPAQMEANATANLTAAVANDATNAGVDWQVCASGCGFFTVTPAIPAIPATATTPYVPAIPAVMATRVSGWSNGLPIPYTAPSTPPMSGTVVVEALSHADGTTANSGTIAISAAPGTSALNGTVQAGTQPVADAAVSLYAAGTSGYASASTQIAAATTDKNGKFTVPAGFACPSPTSQMYLVATGGQVGINAANPNLSLMTALGSCSGLGSSPVVVNEVTTVASAWATAPFTANDELNGNSSSLYLGTSSSNLIGLANAFAAVNNLVDITTGQARFVTPAGNAAVPYVEINILADALNACTASSGGLEGDGSSCGNLFTATDTLPAETYSGAIAPSDTLQAAFNIAQQPAGNYGYSQLDIDGVFQLALSTSPYQPILTTKPNDWSISLNYTSGGGLTTSSKVGSFAVDANGNLWITDTTATDTAAGSVIEWNAVGAALSQDCPVNGETNSSVLANVTCNPPAGYSAGGGPIAIDANGNVWISGNGVVTELTNLGTAVPGSPYLGVAGGGSDMAFDAQDNLWMANGAGVNEFSNLGAELSPAAGFTNSGISGITAVGIDSSNNVWAGYAISAAKANSAYIAELTNPGGEPIVNGEGQAGAFLPGIAADGAGDIWGIISPSDYVCKAPPYGGLGTVLNLDSTCYPDDGNSNLSPSGYNFFNAGGLALDGAGMLWVASQGGGTSPVIPPSILSISVSLSSGSGSGFPNALTSSSLAAGPLHVAVDGSGNVWVLLANNTVTEYVGVATPVVTPIALGVKNKKLAAKP